MNGDAQRDDLSLLEDPSTTLRIETIVNWTDVANIYLESKGINTLTESKDKEEEEEELHEGEESGSATPRIRRKSSFKTKKE